MPANTTNSKLVQPSDTQIAVWRYMDLPKFVSLLKDRALYFARIDCLEDKFEGSISKAEYDHWNDAGVLELEPGLTALDDYLNRVRAARVEHYVSCWHMNDGESEAMWKLYGMSNSAIAVRTTYQSLASALPSNELPNKEIPLHFGPYLGMVKYVNYQTEFVRAWDSLELCMQKRTSFSFEHECRAILHRGPSYELQHLPRTQQLVDMAKLYPTGLTVEVDLNALIHEVVISPFAPGWFKSVVEDVIDKYDFNFKVGQSSIAGQGYF